MRILGKKIHTPRRYIFGRHRRNPVVRVIGNTAQSIASLYNNEYRQMPYNGERWLLERVIEYNQNPVLFDVGANMGDWTAEAIMCDPACEIHSFELVPEHFEKLQARFKAHDNLHLVPFGLSDKKSDVKIFLNGGSSMSSLYESLRNDDGGYSQGHIITGDSYVKDKGIEKINYLKLDVEGSEFTALKGFSKSVEKGIIDVIGFEYGEFNIPARALTV